MISLKKLPYSTLTKLVNRPVYHFSTSPNKSFQQATPESQPVSPPSLSPSKIQETSYDFSKFRIYKSRSTLDLFNMYVMNTVCTKDLFVDNCHTLYRLSNRIIGSWLTERIVSGTMGRIFTAGDSIKTVENFVDKWPNQNIGIYIDYSNEAVPGQVITTKDLDDSMQVFCDSIVLAAKAGSKSGIAIKVSALCFSETMLKANKAQTNVYNVFSKGFENLEESLTARQLVEKFTVDLKMDVTLSDLSEFLSLFFNKKINSEADLDTVTINKFEWLNNMHGFYINNPQKNSNKILSQIVNLDFQDLYELNRLAERLNTIFERAYENKCTVLVDAEQTYIQATIDSFALQYSEIFNKEMPIVLNTFQNYLKMTKGRVMFEVERCRSLKIAFGMKLVRGAYMVEERKLAKELSYEDPIHGSVEETHSCYDDNLKYIISNWLPGSHLMVASHNEKSIMLGKSLVKEFNITENKGNVTFIQLLGLADHLTYSTAEEGYTQAKYVPFGPISIMVPYLIRRAQESKQMLASAALQRRFVLKELRQRITKS